MHRHGAKASKDLGAEGELTLLAFCIYLYVQCIKRDAPKKSVYLL